MRPAALASNSSLYTTRDCNHHFSCSLARADLKWVLGPHFSAHSEFFVTVRLFDLIIWRNLFFLLSLADQKILSVGDLIFIFSETLLNFMFKSLMSFGNPPTESIEVQELSRFLYYLDILNKLLLLQRKHSKYMYAKCLNFPCFVRNLAACILHDSSARPTKVDQTNVRVNRNISDATDRF